MRRIFICAFLLHICLVDARAQSKTVNIWLTTPDGKQKLMKQHSIMFTSDKPSASDSITVTVNDQKTYQTMDGFGAAMTGTSAYVLTHYLKPAQRDSVMSDLFGYKGIRLGYVRQIMGASGFEIGGEFSYDDMPAGQTDSTLQHFSIARDEKDVVPMLQLALTKNKQLKIFGSPCSAPGWMKTTGSLKGQTNGVESYLLPQYYQAYANYFVKYVQAYAAHQIPIYSVTIQNEPEYAPATYPGMRMAPHDQAVFLKDIGPAFNAHKINTGVMVFDHNWGPPVLAYQYPIQVFDDATARPYTIGSAFHNYGGDASMQSLVHYAYPDKGIWFTEGSGGEWIGDFRAYLKGLVGDLIIQSTRHWAKSICLWNLALDKDNALQKAKPGPEQNCVQCTALVMIDPKGNVTHGYEYYALAHISKFAYQGSVRIASATFINSIETVAFKNPDGSKALLAINNGKVESAFKVKYGTQSFTYTLPAGAVATFTWTGKMQKEAIKNAIKTIDDGMYVIKSINTGAVLTSGANKRDVSFEQMQRDISSPQKWFIEKIGNDVYRMIAYTTGLTLNDPNRPSSGNVAANEQVWRAKKDQQWKITQLNDGYYNITNLQTGMVLQPVAQIDGKLQLQFIGR